MSIPLRGDGLYSFLEEIAGLRSMIAAYGKCRNRHVAS
jgi:hypothetical protein